MKEIKAPDFGKLESLKSIFLAGGITKCPDWQFQIVQMLKDTSLTFINPRRPHFDTSKTDESEKQIQWEAFMLRSASAVSFWFPKETLCPIALFELGKMAASPTPIFVGVHENYARKLDIEVQLRIMRPQVKIVYDLGHLAEQIRNWGK